MIEFIWRDKMTKTNKKGEKSPQKRKQNLPVGVMHSFVRDLAKAGGVDLER